MPSTVSRSSAVALKQPTSSDSLEDDVQDSGMSHVVSQGSFSKVLKDSARLLPHQAILENFVHRNPLEVLQEMDFFEAQAHMRKVLSHPSPGARMSALVLSDPRKRANAALVELAAVFLDRGAAQWAAPCRERGFLYFFAEMEGAALMPTLWRSHARATARRVLQTVKCDSLDDSTTTHLLAEGIILENLRALGTPAAEVGATLTAMLFDMQGYAAMFQRMEQHPEEAPVSPSSPSGRICVRLIDFAAVHSTLQRASIEALAAESVSKFCTPWPSEATYSIAFRTRLCFVSPFAEHNNAECGQGWKLGQTMGEFLSASPAHEGQKADEEDQHNPSGLAFVDQNMSRRNDLEQEYERVTLSAIERNTARSREVSGETVTGARDAPRRLLQVYTCIDERECSFRRYLEEAGSALRNDSMSGAKGVETFGVAGFFDFPIRYHGVGHGEEEVLAPAGSLTTASPTWESSVMTEEPHPDDLAIHAASARTKRLLARLDVALEKASFASFDAEVRV